MGIVGLLMFWLVVVIIGVNVDGLFWLAITGLVLFVATGLFIASRIDATEEEPDFWA